jgi:ketosteroid isomerase-like protein
MDATRRKSVAKAFLDAHARVDEPAMIGCLTDDARFHTLKSARTWAGMPDVITGATTIAGMLATRHGAHGGPALWQAGHTTWEHHFLVEEDPYVVLFTTRRSLTVQDTEYENPYVCMFRFEGDRIADLWEYLDTAYTFSIVPQPKETTSAWRGE